MIDSTRIDLGSVEALPALPAEIRIKSRLFFLTRGDAGYRLIASTCPHQGGTVQDRGTHFECPLHNWRFDRTTGRCLNAPSRTLASFVVHEAGGRLYADVPIEPHVERVRRVGGAKLGLTIHLHAHACLEISYNGFTLLTDPWIDGPAFLGAWAPYPPPATSAEELRPDAILLTHEHSDHFHEPTLAHFDRSTTIYVPDFANERMPARLAALGFHDVRRMRFGQRIAPAADWALTAFEPDSYWNDAFVLIDVDGFRIFDVNDAGLNTRIAGLVGHVDVLAIQFSAGASGYPWTWSHLTDEQKAAISKQACAGKLELIRESVSRYTPSSVLPFASHFTLWHPSHQRYARQMTRNTLDDVKAAVADLPVDVIDLLPGDEWNVGRAEIVRGPHVASEVSTREAMLAYMAGAVDRDAFARAHPSGENLTRAELEAYLDALNEVPEIVLCEDLTVRICGTAADESDPGIDVAFAIHQGRLQMLDAVPDRANLTMTMPLAVLTAVVRNRLSWDEAFIGYWCQFDRYPNVYHAGFWRLFQAPYFKRPARMAAATQDRGITPQSTVAEVLEAYGEEADRILRRYGLYCLGCQHSFAESIELAARQHGIDARRTELLVRHLNSAIGSGAVHAHDLS